MAKNFDREDGPIIVRDLLTGSPPTESHLRFQTPGDLLAELVPLNGSNIVTSFAERRRLFY
jgi:hypothetical protein